MPALSPCTSYSRGHRVHFIQVSQHAKADGGDRLAEVLDGAGELITVRFEDGTITRYRNHEADRFRALLARAQDRRVTVSERWSLLLLPSPEGRYCFCITVDGGVPLTCSDVPSDFVIRADGTLVPARPGQGFAPRAPKLIAPRASENCQTPAVLSPDMTTHQRPAAVIYGAYEWHESFAVFEATHAHALAAQFRALWACRTKAEFLALSPSLPLVFPGYDTEDFADVEDPLNFETFPGAEDGDWPRMVTANVLNLFKAKDPIWDALRAEAGAVVEFTALNGDYVQLPLDREADLVAVLARHGITATRDDALIAALDIPRG